MIKCWNTKWFFIGLALYRWGFDAWVEFGPDPLFAGPK